MKRWKSWASGRPGTRWSPEWKCSRSCWMKVWLATTLVCCCVVSTARTSSGTGNREARQHHAAHEVQGGSIRADKGRRRTTHAVLYRLSTAVLLPHDRRDGSGDVAGGSGDGDAG